MPSFDCRVGASDGRIVEREFEATSVAVLREQLQTQGFHVLSIRRRPFRHLFDLSRSSGLGGRRFLAFNQELLVLIRSGLPILQVLDTIIERTERGPLPQMLKDIREDIRGGAALSDALERFPHTFPHLYVASIRAGERTGDLPVIITRYIAYQKKIEAIRDRVKGAMFYPLLLCLASLSVVFFLLLYVIPSFTQIYADAQIELPLLTRLLIVLAEGLTSSVLLWAPSLAVLVIGCRLFIRTVRGRRILDRLKLNLPFFGTLSIEYALSGFCRTLGTILAGGIPAIQALRMARGTLNNCILEEKVEAAIKRVDEGMNLSSSLAKSDFFPLVALRMIAAGESSGALIEMLTEVSEYYEGEVERRLGRMTTLIEPLMMLSMGLLIGGIVIAMYIPIFQLAGTVR